MKKFPSIPQYRNIVKYVRDNSNWNSTPIPTITFSGTVKLHGTNAGIYIGEYNTVPQSRENVITIQHDNAGFAHFVASKNELWPMLAGFIAGVYNKENPFNYTIFGEWCGGNIQSKVGLNNLPKHFVIFNVYDHDSESFLDKSWMDYIINGHTMLDILNTQSVHLIKEIPSYSITIDFNQPEQATSTLEQLTLEVEESCPWTVHMGSHGIGEGIVWVNADSPDNSNYWFKTKGVKHQGKDVSKVKTISADPVKVGKIRELVDILLPEWRLEQGIKALKDENEYLLTNRTGEYLKWIATDVLKEEVDTIANNEFTWKELSGHVMNKARNYYFQELKKV